MSDMMDGESVDMMKDVIEIDSANSLQLYAIG